MEQKKLLKLAKKVMKRQSLILIDGDNAPDDVVDTVDAISTPRFKTKDIKGLCCRFHNSKIRNPEEGINYLVRFGDPLEFEAEFVGVVEIDDELENLIYQWCEENKVFNSLYSSNRIFIFKQGYEYILLDTYYAKIVKKVK